MEIVFLGTDGSGKSTIISQIMPVLNHTFYKSVHYEHLRPNYFPSLARLFGKSDIVNEAITAPHGSSESGFFVSLLRWNYYLLDYTLGYFLKIYLKKIPNVSIHIFDRYYYDYLIDQKRLRVKLPKWIIKFGEFIIPEPDIIFCLGTDAEKIHNRKPELSLEEVERQLQVLKEFCKNHKRAIWLDTGRTIEASSEEALSIILNVMKKQFKSSKTT